MQTKTKTKTKTKTRKNTPIAGEAIAAGGFGCVFKPAIRCSKDTTRKDGVSKLLRDYDANDEMSEIKKVKPYLEKVKDFQNYFLIDGISKCSPGALDAEDKKKFDIKCKNLTQNGINASNVNSRLATLGQINMPDGGIDANAWLMKEPLTETRMAFYNNLLINLLEKGVVPMNSEGVLHGDLKANNILIDEKNVMRIIDWGLAGISTDKDVIPKVAFNRPVQFNLPFTTIIFGNAFQRSYKDFVNNAKKNGDGLTYDNIRYFVLNNYLKFVNDWSGHHNYSKRIFNDIFNEKINFALVRDDNMDRNTYTSATLYLHYIAKYISSVLANFTTASGSFDREGYFKNTYIHNADVWGLFTAYYPFFTINASEPNRFKINSTKKKLFLNTLRTIFVTQILDNSNKRIDISKLVGELKKLNTILGVNPSIKVKTPTPSSPQGLQILLTKPAVKPAAKPAVKSAIKRKRCPKGTRRNKKTGRCESKNKTPTKKKALSKKVKLVLKQKSQKIKRIIVKKVRQTRKRCPKGSRRDKKTGKCKNTATGQTVPE